MHPLAAIGLFILGLYLALMAVAAAIIVAPAAAVAILVAWVAREHCIAALLEGRAHTSETAQAISLRIDPAACKLSWTLAQDSVKALAQKSMLMPKMLLSGLPVGAVGVLITIAAIGAPPHQAEAQLLAYVFLPLVAAAAIIAFAVHFGGAVGLEKALLARIKQLEAITTPRLAELQQILLDQQAAVVWTGLAFPAETGLDDKQLKLEALRDPAAIEAQVAQACDRARTDLVELRKFGALYADARRACAEAEVEVRRTGSPLLLARLDEVHVGLQSNELLGLVPLRQWKDFGDIARMMIDDLRILHDDARRFTEAGHGKRGANRPPNRDEPRTLDDAYLLLCIPATASDEQIKRVYRALVAVWHPDAGATDDRRMKSLNLAYDMLRKSRGFN